MQVIGAPIAAGLMMMDGLRGIRGWKWLFLIEGAITVLFGILFFVSALFSGRPLPYAYCMLCCGKRCSLRPHLAMVMKCDGKWLFQIEGATIILFGMLFIVSALLIKVIFSSYQPRAIDCHGL